MILRAKTKYLFDKFPLTEEQHLNSKLNIEEIERGDIKLISYPRRIVLELTNACNLHCIMCGRETKKFTPTVFSLKWLDVLVPALKKSEEVALFGWGEPTVHPNFVEIIKYLDNYPLRKYFCTNGMKLGDLENAIFDHNIDIIAISLDGACAETNNRIRCGSDFNKIVNSLKSIVSRKKKLGINRPYLNFVFCAMKSNYDELPDLVKLAADIGIDEVKVVYFTAFSDELISESLWNKFVWGGGVISVFKKAVELAARLDVVIKLPHFPGEDEAGDKYHKDCYVGWRDLFLGSDGYIRPCMSTPDKFFRLTDYNNFEDIWNHQCMQNFRRCVNNPETMPISCRNCYQSSHCNWNKKESFIQVGFSFAPEWENLRK